MQGPALLGFALPKVSFLPLITSSALVLSAVLTVRLTWLVALPQFTEHLMRNFPRSRLFSALFAHLVWIYELIALPTFPAFNWFQVAHCVSVCLYMCIHTYTDKHRFLISIHLRNINIFALVFLPDSSLRKWDFETALKRTNVLVVFESLFPESRVLTLLIYPNHTTSGRWFTVS